MSEKLLELATFIEAQRRHTERQLVYWFEEAKTLGKGGIVSWLRDSKGIVPTGRSFSLAEQVLQCGGCEVLWLHDRRYPARLKRTLGTESPPLLYCRGNLQLFERPQFAIIGMREASEYGLKSARAYAEQIAQSGWGVVSGNAIGVDASAHDGALRAGGTTIVFPPTPIEQFIPNFTPSDSAAEHILVASRYAPGSEVTPWNFLGRNVLVAALCRGALVAETGMHGGTLDTVSHLRRFRRSLFVVEMPKEAPCYEAHRLLVASGAKVVPLTPTVEFVKDLLASLEVSVTPEDDPPAQDLFDGLFP
ncbi:MAG: DNA-protecting protein DprA [Candidatus Sumerlaeaceae bacterium]|nr:DNA-protecting protein DprA [Candidatus Sumerlaeaceae bacterium]